MFPILEGGGRVRLTWTASWVALNCDDGSRSSGTCDDTFTIGEFPPIRWATNRKKRRTRFRFSFLPWTGLDLSIPQRNGLECTNTGVGFDPPDGPTPRVDVPVRKFYGRRTTITVPPRTYGVSAGDITGTRTFSLRMRLKKFVMRRFPCRGSGPHRHFVCSNRDHGKNE